MDRAAHEDKDKDKDKHTHPLSLSLDTVSRKREESRPATDDARRGSVYISSRELVIIVLERSASQYKEKRKS
jgi:hypothetical protein